MGEVQSLGLTGNSDGGGERVTSAQEWEPRPDAEETALPQQLSQERERKWGGEGGPLSLALGRGWKEGWQRCLSYFMNKRESPEERGGQVLPLVNVVGDDGRCFPRSPHLTFSLCTRSLVSLSCLVRTPILPGEGRTLIPHLTLVAP